MNESDDTTSIMFECASIDDLGHDLIPMYRILFGISCITVPIGALLCIVYLITFIFRAKKVFNVKSHALLLSCLAQILLGILQGPIRMYYYYHHGCLPLPGAPLCVLTVYLDYIPTQINNFLVAQLSIERFLLVVKPFIFHRARGQKYSYAIIFHYIGLFVAITFPCIYYPTIMQNGASTIDLDDPSQTPTCDLWYARDIYETFDLLITFTPYSIVLFTHLLLITVLFYRKFVIADRQRRQAGSRKYRRLLFSLNLFLIWFLLTWSPWVLYDFFQSVLNFTYSVYIDAITTFIVYLNYTFSSAIVLITFQDMYQFCLDNFFSRWRVCLRQRRVVPAFTVTHGQTIGLTRRVGTIQTVDPNLTVQYVARNPRLTAV
ncbi:unnamed protein product [Adineta steineri]|uniref:G-protein coupled receptors family 1 profile domain-containing protein n=1 Tax=Adineta steineri TaxID=433720 RepID=A0A819Y755_9BILA|nr:unnamed protein product [Adineta steineri]